MSYSTTQYEFGNTFTADPPTSLANLTAKVPFVEGVKVPSINTCLAVVPGPVPGFVAALNAVCTT